MPAPFRPRRLILLAALLLAAGGAGWLALRGFARLAAPAVAGSDIQPPGRWHLQPESLADRRQREELARLVSLPYLATGAPAPARSGVVAYDPERAADGLNLYVSGHGPEARLIGMRGEPLHRWSYPFERAFPDRAPTDETVFWRRVHLLPDGDLLVVFQGGGLIRLDRDSRLRWRVDSGFYNDLFVAADGAIFGIAKEARLLPRIHPTEPVLEDFIVEITPAGEVVRRVSLLACFLDSPYAGLLEPMASSGDIFHTNTIEIFDGAAERLSPLYRRGLALVSLREVDIVAVVDPQRRTVVWAVRGPWKAQHQPTLLADGSLLLFDNRGADGHSRVLELDPASGAIGWEYRGGDGRPLASPQAGSSQRLANGNTLITESERGRALEITREGTIVWEFLSPHRGGPRRELVATLFEVVRLRPDEARFLESARQPPSSPR